MLVDAGASFAASRGNVGPQGKSSAGNDLDGPAARTTGPLGATSPSGTGKKMGEVDVAID